ncbi:MAG: hypothetical protein AB7G48_17365 [Nitrospiraceae bacterium]
MRERGSLSSLRCAGLSAVALGLLCLLSAGCLSPIALHQAVLEYDRAVGRVEAEMLLLNIARSRHFLPQHFTGVSSVAATFEFQANAGLTSTVVTPGPDAVGLSFGGSMAERPTITIVPIQGEEFTSRILTPFDEGRVMFMFQQGVEPAIILRLMVSEIQASGYGESASYRNMPYFEDEYREFRRRIMHLSSLNLSRDLRVTSLIFEQTVALPLSARSGSGDVVRGLDKIIDAMDRGYAIGDVSEEPSLTVRRRVTGRTVITNYDPLQLPNEERRLLHEEAQRYPRNYILVDIRPDGPGGDYPLHGVLVIRSFTNIMRFLANGIAIDREYQVEPDERTGEVAFNAEQTLEIVESDSRPDHAAFAVKFEGRWYSIVKASRDDGRIEPWNLGTFRILAQLYQMTVTDISKTATPAITIAK